MHNNRNLCESFRKAGSKTALMHDSRCFFLLLRLQKNFHRGFKKSRLYKSVLRLEAKAFSLVETLMAITIITIVLTAITGLILNTLSVNQRHFRLLQAGAYANEGIEMMRYMRDSNVLQNYTWNGGAALWGGDFSMDAGDELKTLYLQEAPCPPCVKFTPFASGAILKSGDGFSFARRVELRPGENESQVELTVVVDFEWRGKTRSVRVSSFLTDWR